MRAAIASALLACGCNSWPDQRPVEHGFEVDDRLGVEVFRTAGGLRVASVFQQDGLQIYFEEIHDAWHLVEIDPATLDITDLPAPPLLAGERINAGRALAPARAVVASVRDGAAIAHVLQGSTWQTLPALPVTGTEDQMGGILAHHGRVYAAFAERMFVWDGDAWAEPVTRGPVIAAGFDADTQWLLRPEGNGFAAVPVSASGQAGAPVLAPDQAGLPQASAVNGDADRFQVVAGGRLWLFDGAGFVAGDGGVVGTPYAAPGSDRLVVTSGGAPSSTWTFAEDGILGGSALAPFEPLLSCGCDLAVDPTCGCVTHTVGYVDLKPSPATEWMGLTFADDVEGHAVLTARFLELPFDGDPFAPRE